MKPTFGNLGAFVNGNMFMGLFGSSIGVKLPEEDRARLLAEPGAGPFGPEERPMSGYVALPPTWSPRKAAPWTARAQLRRCDAGETEGAQAVTPSVVKVARYEIDPAARSHVEAAIGDFAAYVGAELGDSTRVALQQTANPCRFLRQETAWEDAATRRSLAGRP